MKIAIAADHAGFSLKESLKTHLQSQGFEILDVGCHSAERCDYPDFGAKAAKTVAEGKAQRAVLVCGSGIGMCIAANKIHGVRAAVLRSFDDARLSREHNDANVACFGGRITAVHQAQSLLDVFLKTPFEGGRHINRVKKLDSIDGEHECKGSCGSSR
ncbi:MAG: ribose 5-phosphate isomerase B [Deltaproteobacteria bacterium]|nr:ribose 5-phosphate isomerase B [Deltaproteobacteria bacterium]